MTAYPWIFSLSGGLWPNINYMHELGMGEMRDNGRRHEPREGATRRCRAGIGLGLRVAAVAPACVRVGPLTRHQPVRAHLLENSRRLHQGQHLYDGADAGWLSVAGYGIWLVSLRRNRAVRWQPPDGAQLPSQRIDPLFVDRDGTLWIATDKGLASWRNAKLTTYPEVNGRRIDSLAQDAEGTVWFGVENPGSLCAIRAANTQCYGAGSFGRSIPALYSDHKGNLWVSSEAGLWRWKPGPPEHYNVPGEGVKAHELLEDNKGALLMVVSGSLGVISGAGEGLKQLVDGKIQDYPLPHIAGQFRPTRLLRSSDGSMWIGTLQGLLHLHDGKDRSLRLALTGATAVTCIFEDREGSIWVQHAGRRPGIGSARGAVPMIFRLRGSSKFRGSRRGS